MTTFSNRRRSTNALIVIHLIYARGANGTRRTFTKVNWDLTLANLALKARKTITSCFANYFSTHRSVLTILLTAWVVDIFAKRSIKTIGTNTLNFCFIQVLAGSAVVTWRSCTQILFKFTFLTVKTIFTLARVKDSTWDTFSVIATSSFVARFFVPFVAVFNGF